MLLISETSKQIILLELTVPWEDRIEEAKERKRAKYAELVEECRKNGWRACCEPIEVGCRGFAGQSLCRAYNILGITGASKRRAIKEVTEAAEVALKVAVVKERRTMGEVELPGHKLGPDQPQLGRLGESVGCLKDPKHSVTPGSITEDVSRLHQVDVCKKNK
ncbi:hypothetical protein DPEC_G00178350 [Dallia pectoralis]|uniref:Uncharacterized protein n=1 Tax=Dallia pectoralis TaxID=75939 RepID=A0ACC2GFQ0_DALPE|nr:hypothetical protein DPEC_G00178350 [Dallia pectoralis]